MNLSRRSLLTGLLSSAAVIAVGPVAKVVAVEPFPVSNQTLWLIEHQKFMGHLSQQIATTIWYGNSEVLPTQFAGLAPCYDSSIDGALKLPQDLRSSVLDCGEASCASWKTFFGEAA